MHGVSNWKRWMVVGGHGECSVDGGQAVHMFVPHHPRYHVDQGCFKSRPISTHRYSSPACDMYNGRYSLAFNDFNMADKGGFIWGLPALPLQCWGSCYCSESKWNWCFPWFDRWALSSQYLSTMPTHDTSPWSSIMGGVQSAWKKASCRGGSLGIYLSLSSIDHC